MNKKLIIVIICLLFMPVGVRSIVCNDGHTYTAKVDGTRIYDVKIVFNDKKDEVLDVE